MGLRGHCDDPLYRCRRLLSRADERLDDAAAPSRSACSTPVILMVRSAPPGMPRSRPHGWAGGRERAAAAWRQARREHEQPVVQARNAGRRDRRRLQEQATEAAEREAKLRERFERVATPERVRLRTELSEAKASLVEVKSSTRPTATSGSTNPEAARRRDYLHEQIADAARDLDLDRQDLDGIAPGSGRHTQVAGIDWHSQVSAPDRVATSARVMTDRRHASTDQSAEASAKRYLARRASGALARRIRRVAGDTRTSQRGCHSSDNGTYALPSEPPTVSRRPAIPGADNARSRRLSGAGVAPAGRTPFRSSCLPEEGAGASCLFWI